MPWLAAAVVGSAVVGGLISSHAANNAADVSQENTDRTLALNREQYNQTRADLQPYAQLGQGAAQAVASRLGVTAPTGGAAAPGIVAQGAQGAPADMSGMQTMQTGQADPSQGVQPQAQPQSQAPIAPPAPGGGVAAAPASAAVDPGTYGSLDNPSLSDINANLQDPGSFSFTPQDYKESPGLQFQLDQARKGIEASASARGAVHSGASAMALQDRAQQIAYGDFANERQAALGIYNTNLSRFQADRGYNTQQYQDQRGYLTGRYDTQTNNLLNLTGIGQGAAAGTAAAGTNYTNAATNALNNNATNQANAGLVSASNTNQLLGTGLNAYAYMNGAGSPAGFGATPNPLATNASLAPRYASYGAA